MATIPGPKDLASPQIDTDCQFALEPAFQELLRESVRAGWDPGLASRALIGLAAAKLKGIQAEQKTSADMEALARSTP